MVSHPILSAHKSIYITFVNLKVSESNLLISVVYSIIVPPSTAAGISATVIVPDGGNASISCTSSGRPVPTITWTINIDQMTSFSQTDVTTNHQPGTNTPGHVASTLHIVHAQYPEHNGRFICTGTNTIFGIPRTDSVSITVQVQSKLTKLLGLKCSLLW